MSREAWSQEHEERRVHATHQANRPDPTVFRAWAFADDPALVARAHQALLASTPAATPAWLLAAAPATPAPDQTRRQHVLPLGTEVAEQGRAGQIAWLDWLGSEVDDRERRSWAQAYDAVPADDAADAAIWAGLIHGSPWGVRDACEARWLPIVERVFLGVLAGRELPVDVRHRVIADLREAFFFRLLGPENPGWRDIAVRVLETVAPLVGPGTALGAAARKEAGGCLSRRGGWAQTLQHLLPDAPDREGRAVVATRWFEDPTRLEALIDLHVVLRLIERQPADLDTAWRIVTQNRGKARGRLRALLGSTRRWDGLFALDGLSRRTDAALARYAWSWAWQELAHDFSFDASRTVTPPCEPQDDGFEPLTHDGADALDTWVLLVLLKGRLPHLQLWVRTGGTGDRDSTWARLQQQLPGDLRSPDQGYKRVRIHLADHLDPILGEWSSTLVALLQITPGRHLKEAFLTVLRQRWHPAIELPRSGFPTFQDHIRAAIAAAEEEAP